jgi:hypothetical protein
MWEGLLRVKTKTLPATTRMDAGSPAFGKGVASSRDPYVREAHTRQVRAVGAGADHGYAGA